MFNKKLQDAINNMENCAESLRERVIHYKDHNDKLAKNQDRNSYPPSLQRIADNNPEIRCNCNISGRAGDNKLGAHHQSHCNMWSLSIIRKGAGK